MISIQALLWIIYSFPLSFSFPFVVILSYTLLLFTFIYFLLFYSLLDYFLFQLLVPRSHLSFEAQLVAGKSHEFGPICCPSLPSLPSVPSGVSIGKQKHEAELKYPQSIHRLNIFPPSKIEVICVLYDTSLVSLHWFPFF